MPFTGVGSVDTLNFEQYESTLSILLQQETSKFRNTGVVKPCQGTGSALLNQIGEVDTSEVAGRHGDTPITSTNYDRRWVNPVELEVANLVDKMDDLRNIADPRGQIARIQSMRLGRDTDDVILKGLVGANQTGESGTVSTSFAAGNIIDSGSSTKLTVDKLRELQEKMRDNDIDLDGGESVVGLISPQMARHLLEQPELTSADYNSVKTLVDGGVGSFMGFNFIISNRIPGATKYNSGTIDVGLSMAANKQRALFYPQSGLCIGMWQDVNTDVSIRNDKRNSTQIYSTMVMGATRTEENKVYAVDVDTSA